MNIRDFRWIREPASCVVTDGRVEVITKPHTDLWQRTEEIPQHGFPVRGHDAFGRRSFLRRWAELLRREMK